MIQITLDWYRYDAKIGRSAQGVMDVKWPAVPREGEHVEIPTPGAEGGDYVVHSVRWNADGSARVHLR